MSFDKPIRSVFGVFLCRLVIILYALFSFPLSSLAQQLDVLRVADMKQLNKSLLQASGVLKNLPYEVEFFDFSSAGDIARALNARAVDIGPCGDAPLTFALASGAHLKAVAVSRSRWVGDDRGYGHALLVKHNSTIQDLTDLKGKRISTVKGSIGHYLAIKALQRVGLSSKDIKFIFLSPADSRTVLFNGEVDVWSTWAPYTGIARHYDKAKVLAEDGQPLSVSLYQIASDVALEEKEDIIRDFLQRYAEASEWANQYPDKYAAEQSKATGVAVGIYQLINRQVKWSLSQINNADVQKLQDIADIYRQEGVINDSVNVADGLLLEYFSVAPGIE